MERSSRKGYKAYDSLKSQEAAYIDDINRAILKDEDFEFMHVPALAQRLEIYKRKFLEFDVDTSGSLDIDEFKELLLSVGAAKTDQAVKKLFKKCLYKSRNAIYYKDFVYAMLADTMRLGVVFNEEQDIVDKINRKRMQEKKRKPTFVGTKRRNEKVYEKKVQYEEEDEEEEEKEQEQKEERNHEDEEGYEDNAITQEEGEENYEDEYEESVLSHTERNENNEENVEEEQEQDQEVEENEQQDEGEAEEDNQEEEPEVDYEEEEEAPAKLAPEPRVMTEITRGVEQVHLLRSEAPQGQGREGGQGYQVVQGQWSRRQDQLPRPSIYRREAMQEVDGQRGQAPRRAEPTLVTNIQNSMTTEKNPPPVVCTSRNLPPEATRKVPVSADPRPSRPGPYTYVCTDPNCPDSYPQPQSHPLCTDPNCPYNRVNAQQLAQPSVMQQPVKQQIQYPARPVSPTFIQHQPYPDYYHHQPVVPVEPIRMSSGGMTCPYGHRCPSPPPQPAYNPQPVLSDPSGYNVQPAFAKSPGYEPQPVLVNPIPTYEYPVSGSHDPYGMDQVYVQDVHTQYEPLAYYAAPQ